MSENLIEKYRGEGLDDFDVLSRMMEDRDRKEGLVQNDQISTPTESSLEYRPSEKSQKANRRGRPRKEKQNEQTLVKENNQKSSKATFLTPPVKAKLKEVQALMLIQRKEPIRESDIVDMSLDLYINHYKLK